MRCGCFIISPSREREMGADGPYPYLVRGALPFSGGGMPRQATRAYSSSSCCPSIYLDRDGVAAITGGRNSPATTGVFRPNLSLRLFFRNILITFMLAQGSYLVHVRLLWDVCTGVAHSYRQLASRRLKGKYVVATAVLLLLPAKACRIRHIFLPS